MDLNILRILLCSLSCLIKERKIMKPGANLFFFLFNNTLSDPSKCILCKKWATAFCNRCFPLIFTGTNCNYVTIYIVQNDTTDELKFLRDYAIELYNTL
jgi:hypothetical protein